MNSKSSEKIQPPRLLPEPSQGFKDAFVRWQKHYITTLGYMTLPTQLESFYELAVNERVQDNTSPHGLGYRDLTDSERQTLDLD